MTPQTLTPLTLTPHTVTLRNLHQISDDRARLDMEFVIANLASAYWAIGRPRELTLRSWAHCHPFGIYTPGGAPCGFGRLLTDYAMRAHLGDVFIRPEARGGGLGKALIAHILAHPALTTVAHWTLTTNDAHGLYERFGFHTAERDGKWMTRDIAPVPPSPP